MAGIHTGSQMCRKAMGRGRGQGGAKLGGFPQFILAFLLASNELVSAFVHQTMCPSFIFFFLKICHSNQCLMTSVTCEKDNLCDQKGQCSDQLQLCECLVIPNSPTFQEGQKHHHHVLKEIQEFLQQLDLTGILEQKQEIPLSYLIPQQSPGQ